MITPVYFCVMNVRTERQTDRPHELHVYVGLAQARPKYHRKVRLRLAVISSLFTVVGIYIALAVDIIDGCGLIKKTEQGKGVFAVH